ncbi:MAG: aminoacetone oxidase family FAD-binding enzyme [Cyanobacteriota bacterium]|nr:aminoacetone oxidase family FAD-binding enzyme [Cyanobacteriota bacterium]
MVQESTSNKSVAIIGAGPAGCVCAKFLKNNGFCPIIFDKGKYLRTILPTGGGRCNLAHAEFDFKNLTKNYPRGEKFLYSVFSKFGTEDAIQFFKQLGIETYTQEDNRIFPKSNSSRDVQEKLLKALKGCKFISEKVLSIEKLDNCYKIITNKSSYAFDVVIVSTGGHGNWDIFNKMDLNIIPPTQALVGLVTKEKFSAISGVSIKNVKTYGKEFKNSDNGDIIFTHKGISGPLIYKISSIFARKEMPYKLVFQLVKDLDLQAELNKNPHKEIKNLLGQFVPKSFAEFVLENLDIEKDTPCHKITGKLRDKIYKKLTTFEVTIISKVPDGEVVTCGGIDLKEINSKTMESKKYPNLYFCGEVLDIDGFCGGFNLQNCWSTAFVVAQSVCN